MVEALNQNYEEMTHSNSEEVILSVNGVSKKFCRDLKRSLLYGVQDIASDLVGLRQESDKLRPKEFWALQDVSFQLRRGEALGLVGKNGSGKSTLLRIIAGLIKPDAGSVEAKGRVAPLIALSAGFNPILTGRENIYANMSILGLSKKEIDDRFDQVVEFAEIGDAIESPLQTYSSGMAARLGFASAIHTDPDILLIDEVLAVGDIKFRAKCYRKLASLLKLGTSFIMVSHDPQSILQMCNSAIYLSKGKLICTDMTFNVMQKYEQDLFLGDKKTNLPGFLELEGKPSQESQGLDIQSIYFSGSQDDLLQQPLRSGFPTKLHIVCKAREPLKNVNVYLKVSQIGGGEGTVLQIDTANDGNSFEVEPGVYVMSLEMPYLGLPSGVYSMSIKLKQERIYTLDFVESFQFTVESSGTMHNCRFYQPRSWNITKKQ